MILKGKVALVTGASRGIGRAIAVDLAKHGAEVALAGRDEAALGETVAACKSARADVKTLVLTGDVADRAAVDDFAAKTIETFGRIDSAIANAGQSVDALLLRLKPEVLDQMLSV